MSSCIDKIRTDLVSARIIVVSALETDGVVLLGRALVEAGGNPILVFYDPALIAVARGLVASQPPSTSLAVWKRQASSILSAYRPHRRRIVFVSAAAVEADPQQFRTSLSKCFTLSEDLGSTMVRPTLPSWSAWQLVLASQTLAADLEAALLDGELEAAALPLPLPSCDPDAAFTELEAAAAIRTLQFRQLANVQHELREQFLSGATSPFPSEAPIPQLYRQDDYPPRGVECVEGEPEYIGENGYVDAIRVDHGCVEIRGWAAWKKFNIGQRLLIAGLKTEMAEAKVVPRSDVARHFKDWDYYLSGFEIRLLIESKGTVEKIAVYSIDESGRILRLGLSAGALLQLRSG